MKNDKPASGLIPIDDVIWEFLGNIKSGEERYEDFLGYALDFYSEELNNHGFIGIKNELIKLTPYKTFDLPRDCIDWIAIFVQVGMRLRPLVKDNSLAWNNKELYEQGFLDAIVKDDQDNMHLYSININSIGDNVNQNFHLTEKHDLMGYFTENKELRQFTVHPVEETVTQIVLRYISDCYNNREKTLVPVTAKKVMKAYIDWKDHEFSTSDKKYNRAERKRGLYDIAYGEFQAMEADWDPNDIREMLFDTYTLTPIVS